MTRLRNHLNEKRRALPWVRVEKTYVFDTPDGQETLADLFDGRSQFIVKHFMLAPGRTDPCVGCSFEVDHIDGVLMHIEHHDVSYVAVARYGGFVVIVNRLAVGNLLRRERDTEIGRGAEEVLGAYMYLDLTPKGRNEHGPKFDLTDWARHHDRYGVEGHVNATGRWVAAEADTCCHSS